MNNKFMKTECTQLCFVDDWLALAVDMIILIKYHVRMVI